jgi:hypothetical protein
MNPDSSKRKLKPSQNTSTKRAGSGKQRKDSAPPSPTHERAVPAVSAAGSPTALTGAVPDITVQIRERAYRLFQSSGYQHGHALEHWLEAERQLKVLESSEPPEHKERAEETDDPSRSRSPSP